MRVAPASDAPSERRPFVLQPTLSLISRRASHALWRVASVLEEHMVSHTTFCVLWWLIVFYHLFNASFIFALAAVHIYISQPAIYEHAWLLRIDASTLAKAGWGMVVVAFIHIIAVAIIILQSIASRRLTFRARNKPKVPQPSSPTKQDLVVLTCYRLQKTVNSPITMIQAVFGEKGYFGVDGGYFYLWFYARQVLEIVLQTYQAYQLSRSVPRRWINHFVVGFIVVNCAYVPLVNQWLRHYAGPRLAILLAIELLLDFVMAVLVPTFILMGHAFEVNWAAGKFDEIYTYDDVWLTTTLAEVRQQLVSSSIDFISTLWPHVAGILTLDDIKKLIQRSHPSGHRAKPVSPVQAVSKANRVYYTFALGCGLFVALCDGTANRHSSTTLVKQACLLEMHPWFATNATCAVVHINCYRQNVSGESHEIALTLATMERSTMVRLILSHCPALAVPSILTQFHNLIGLHVFNSTLVEWPMQAAMTQSKTPHLSQLHLVSTNMTIFPTGIVHASMPVKLSLLIYDSNMTTLPDVFADEWQSHLWPYFDIEHTDLSSLPPSFPHVRAEDLSLVGNKLSSLPDAFLSTEISSFRVSSNNLTTMPAMAGGEKKLYRFLAENTRVEALPGWLIPWESARQASGQKTVISFGGSPLCENASYRSFCLRIPAALTNYYRYDILIRYRQL